MVKYQDDALDTVFSALADRTRRGVLAALAEGERPVTELAAAHAMSLPGFLKHLRVLENAGLIAREKEGRVVSCTLSATPMKAAAGWMAHYEKFWGERLDSLARYLYQQEALQTWTPQSSPKSPRSGSRAVSRSGRRKSGAHGPTRKR